VWLLLLVFAFAVRAHDFGNPVIHVDEQYYLLVGDHMLHGAVPYVDLWDRKPPGLFLLFAAIRLLPGDGILAYQIVATLFAAATAGVLVLAAGRLGARPIGGAAARSIISVDIPPALMGTVADALPQPENDPDELVLPSDPRKLP
jgi:4-amino-4-deoxy-L-arabinose transferase-like glycosyltransferase